MDLVRPILTIFAAVAVLCGCMPRSGEATAIFTDSQSKNRWDGNKRVIARYARKEDVPKFLSVKGRLYLLVQETHPGLVDTVVNIPEWDSKELIALSKARPEFRATLATVRWQKLPD